tara:strand:- start:51 stop:329 length:279 start_codon:yes stop_codon:yes gene_type:complete
MPTFSKVVATTITEVFPPRRGRKSFGLTNRSGNNNVAIISREDQSFSEGFRIVAGQTVTMNTEQDGKPTLENAIRLISETGNNTVDCLENFE